MNEDFVPYELAIKLKEKGFTCEYPFAMYNKYEQFCPLYSSDKYYFGIDDFDEHACIAPTISQVLKWLREEKKIHIVCPFYKDKGFYYYVQRIGNAARIVSSFDDSDTCFDTAELAALAGIEYVIDNLI